MEDKVFYNGKEIDVPDIKRFSRQAISQYLFNKNYPELFNYINNYYPDKYRWLEKLYLFVNHLEEPPKCIYCGKPVTFKSFSKGYHKFCSSSCSNKFNVDNVTKTCLEKFHSKRPMGNQKIKEKVKQTNQLRYGADNYSQTEECKEKVKQTCNEKFGVDNPMQNQEIKDKLFQSYFENTGYKSPTQNPNVMNKIITTRRTKFMQEHDWLIDYTEEGEWVCKCPHPNDCELWNECNHQYVITSIIQSNRLNDQIEVCTKRNPLGYCKSPWEQLIKRFFDKLKIKYLANTYSLIKNSRNNPIEIDIYLPTRKIGIEINGSYIHSLDCSSTEEFQHIEKHQKCLEKGIELIYLWGDWIRHNPSIVKEFIIDKLSNKPLLRYKSLWFPDLDDSQWPLDLGWYDNTPPNPDEIIPHYCKHGKSSDLHQCCDSGIISITR